MKCREIFIWFAKIKIKKKQPNSTFLFMQTFFDCLGVQFEKQFYPLRNFIAFLNDIIHIDNLYSQNTQVSEMSIYFWSLYRTFPLYMCNNSSLAYRAFYLLRKYLYSHLRKIREWFWYFISYFSPIIKQKYWKYSGTRMLTIFYKQRKPVVIFLFVSCFLFVLCFLLVAKAVSVKPN